MKRLLRFFLGRGFIITASITIQLAVILWLIYKLSTYSIVIYFIMSTMSFVFAVLIAADNIPSASKTAWLFPMLLMPVLGWTLFFMFCQRKTSRLKKKYLKSRSNSVFEITQETKEKLYNEDYRATVQSIFLIKNTGSSIYCDSNVAYYPNGEQFIVSYLEELKKAEQFIFIEYFIIGEGKIWNSISEILIQKAKTGVDIRILYDDFIAIFAFNSGYDNYLKSKGIKIMRFNKLTPYLSMSHNYRDHRKITVIDGKTGFTGGLNLADEYVNLVQRFGYWKDTAVKLTGNAVNELTKMFLEAWNFTCCTEFSDLNSFKYYNNENNKMDNGFIVPFGDSPMSDFSVSKLAYINMINMARKYIYITTPYLIIDEEMITALTLASRNGIDVRIITPNIPDKKYVQIVTRSNYSILMKAGVRVYEYRPGFIHSKIILSDDKFSIIGTVNFDFRSFYMLFENGLFMYKTECINDIKNDYKDMIAKSIEISEKTFKYNILQKFFTAFMRLLSPFL